MAADEPQKRIQAVVHIEIQNDWNYKSDDPDNKTNQLYTTTEPEVTFHLLQGLSLYAHGVLEPVQDPAPGEDRTFQDLGLFMEDLFVRYEVGGFSVIGGKFTQNFGIAWDLAPGIYGTDVAEDNYQLTERIGIQVGYTHDFGAAGKHGLTASTFFLDTSPLYDSIGQSRQPATRGKEDGGLSNTEDFSSFDVALSGGEIPALPGFLYHIAYVYQAAGETEMADEQGVAIGAQYAIPLTENLMLTPLVEYVAFGNALGVKDQEQRFLTMAAELRWQGWNAAVAYTGTKTDVPDGKEIRNRHFQVSAGYEFDFGLSINGGWLADKTDCVETKTLGLLFAYTVSL